MTLTVTGLSVERSGRTILYPTSLSIEAGERVGIVGASGSGKSTLGHALIDALRRDGVSVAHVTQTPDDALDPLRTMGFHWSEAERALGTTPDVDRRTALFEALSIAHGDLRKRPWGWSRGMQQRFVIAMALIGTPDLIVLDEPTSALDPVVAARTMDLLDDCLSGGTTAMLLITHDLALAARRVDRVVVLDMGRVVENASTDRLLAAPQSKCARALCAHKSWLVMPC